MNNYDFEELLRLAAICGMIDVATDKGLDQYHIDGCRPGVWQKRLILLIETYWLDEENPLNEIAERNIKAHISAYFDNEKELADYIEESRDEAVEIVNTMTPDEIAEKIIELDDRVYPPDLSERLYEDIMIPDEWRDKGDFSEDDFETLYMELKTQLAPKTGKIIKDMIMNLREFDDSRGEGVISTEFGRFLTLLAYLNIIGFNADKEPDGNNKESSRPGYLQGKLLEIIKWYRDGNETVKNNPLASYNVMLNLRVEASATVASIAAYEVLPAEKKRIMYSEAKYLFETSEADEIKTMIDKLESYLYMPGVSRVADRVIIRHEWREMGYMHGRKFYDFAEDIYGQYKELHAAAVRAMV